MFPHMLSGVTLEVSVTSSVVGLGRSNGCTKRNSRIACVSTRVSWHWSVCPKVCQQARCYKFKAHRVAGYLGTGYGLVMGVRIVLPLSKRFLRNDSHC